MNQNTNLKTVSENNVEDEALNHYRPPYTGHSDKPAAKEEGPVSVICNAESFTQPLSIVPPSDR